MPGWFKKDEKQDPPKDDNKNDQSALLDAFAAKLDEKLKPFEERIQKVSDWQENLENSLKDQAPPPDNKDGELTPEQKLARDMNNIRNESTLTRAMLIERNVLDAIGSDWAYLKPDLVKIFATTSIQAKSAPNYADMCQNAVTVLIGREVLKGGSVRRDSHGKFFIEESISSSADRDNPIHDLPTWQSDDRTETAAETLRKLKIDPEKFAEDYKSGRLN